MLQQNKTETARSLAYSILVESLSELQFKLIERLIYGICGRFPREILDPSSLLLFALLKQSPVQNDHQSLLRQALNKENFLLGNEALDMTLSVLSQCTKEAMTEKVFMEYVDDIWQIHCSEDAGGIVGGDRIKMLQSKYCPNGK